MSDYWYPGRIIRDHFTKPPSKSSRGGRSSGGGGSKSTGIIEGAINWVGENVVAPVVNTAKGVGGWTVNTVRGGVDQLKGGIEDAGSAVKAAVVGKDHKVQTPDMSDPRVSSHVGGMMTEVDVGKQYEQEYFSGGRNLMSGSQSAFSNLLNFDIHKFHIDLPGTKYDSPLRRMVGISEKDVQKRQAQHYYEGLAEHKRYAEQPARALISPAAITLYTLPVAWGTGGVISKAGITAARHVPKAAKAIGVSKWALMGVGAVGTAQRSVGASKKRTVVHTPASGESYTAQEGGIGAGVSHLTREGLAWRAGIKGAQAQPLQTVFRPSGRISRSMYMNRLNPLIKKYPQSLASHRVYKKGGFPTVKKGSVAQVEARIQRKFSRPEILAGKGKPQFLDPKTGKRLVGHMSERQLSKIKGGLFVTPGETGSPHFTRTPSMRNIALYPKKSTVEPKLLKGIFGKYRTPKYHLIRAKSGKLHAVPPTGAKGVVEARTPHGHPTRFYAKDIGKGKLYQHVTKGKSELEAVLPGGTQTEHGSRLVSHKTGFRKILNVPKYYVEYGKGINKLKVPTDVYDIKPIKPFKPPISKARPSLLGRKPFVGIPRSVRSVGPAHRSVAPARRSASPTFDPSTIPYLRDRSRTGSYDMSHYKRSDRSSGYSDVSGVEEGSSYPYRGRSRTVTAPSVAGIDIKRYDNSRDTIHKPKQYYHDEEYYNELRESWGKLFGGKK